MCVTLQYSKQGKSCVHNSSLWSGEMNGTLCICVLILCCSYLCAGVAVSYVDSNLLVRTTNGMVLGKYSNVGNARVFKSIPYGGPVSGTNRWTDPQPHANWNGVWDTTIDRPSACPQDCEDPQASGCASPDIQTEDCLFLNVYTPYSATRYSNLPVLVFIHGGAFVFGYSTDPLYDGSYLASNSDIIVVTINYRLGPLGFLVLGSGSDAIDGNFGIKDQRLALHWVQDNIARFGGDPSQVTLSGESAGAMSVAIHMTSTKSTGLFHQAIVESDPFGVYYRTAEEEKKIGDEFARNLTCCSGGSGQESSLDCLRNKPLWEILEFSNVHKLNYSAEDIWTQFLTWAPVIDGDQLTDQPLNLFINGHFNKVPTIMGTTAAEGIIFVYGTIPFKVETLEYYIALAVLFKGKYQFQLLNKYPPNDKDCDQRPQLSVLVTDDAFYCPTVLSAKSLANVVPVYSYIFNHSFPGLPEKYALCKENSCHGAELPYVFHTLEKLYTDGEKELADTVSKYWGNFVNTGNPNSPPASFATYGLWAEPSPVLPEWPHFTTNEWNSLSMNVGNFQAESDPRKQFCELLDSERPGAKYSSDRFGSLRLT